MMQDVCEAMQLLLQAELDGELDAAGAASLAAHRHTCPGCASMQEALATQSQRLRGVTRFRASPALRQAVLTALPPPSRRTSRVAFWQHGASFGAGLAVAASVAVLLLGRMPDAAVPDLVAAHIRALQPGHLLDVPSTDQHTVKPWFDGRLDYAPPVRDLAQQGFPLVGGRLDYVGGRPVAVLVYGRRLHRIDLFVWPGAAAPSPAAAQGYNIVGWSQDGMSFRAVSDLNRTELDMFGNLWRAGS